MARITPDPITQDPIIRARRPRITAILRRRLAILRQHLAILRQRPAMRRRLALPLVTQWPTARSVTGHITRKPEPISGLTASVITAPERFLALAPQVEVVQLAGATAVVLIKAHRDSAAPQIF